jgi:hypothetical protein
VVDADTLLLSMRVESGTSKRWSPRLPPTPWRWLVGRWPRSPIEEPVGAPLRPQVTKAYVGGIADGTTDLRRSALSAALRAYCGRNTEAIIVLAKRLARGCIRSVQTIADEGRSDAA